MKNKALIVFLLVLTLSIPNFNVVNSFARPMPNSGGTEPVTKATKSSEFGDLTAEVLNDGDIHVGDKVQVKYTFKPKQLDMTDPKANDVYYSLDNSDNGFHWMFARRMEFFFNQAKLTVINYNKQKAAENKEEEKVREFNAKIFNFSNRSYPLYKYRFGQIPEPSEEQMQLYLDNPNYLNFDVTSGERDLEFLLATRNWLLETKYLANQNNLGDTLRTAYYRIKNSDNDNTKYLNVLCVNDIDSFTVKESNGSYMYLFDDVEVDYDDDQSLYRVVKDSENTSPYLSSKGYALYWLKKIRKDLGIEINFIKYYMKGTTEDSYPNLDYVLEKTYTPEELNNNHYVWEANEETFLEKNYKFISWLKVIAGKICEGIIEKKLTNMKFSIYIPDGLTALNNSSTQASYFETELDDIIYTRDVENRKYNAEEKSFIMELIPSETGRFAIMDGDIEFRTSWSGDEAVYAPLIEIDVKEDVEDNILIKNVRFEADKSEIVHGDSFVMNYVLEGDDIWLDDTRDEINFGFIKVLIHAPDLVTVESMPDGFYNDSNNIMSGVLANAKLIKNPDGTYHLESRTISIGYKPNAIVSERNNINFLNANIDLNYYFNAKSKTLSFIEDKTIIVKPDIEMYDLQKKVIKDRNELKNILITGKLHADSDITNVNAILIIRTETGDSKTLIVPCDSHGEISTRVDVSGLTGNRFKAILVFTDADGDTDNDEKNFISTSTFNIL